MLQILIRKRILETLLGEEKMHQGLLPGPQQATMCPLLVRCIYPVLKSLGFPLLFYSSLLNQQDLTL